jgi:hypothetical protein
MPFWACTVIGVKPGEVGRWGREETHPAMSQADARQAWPSSPIQAASAGSNLHSMATILDPSLKVPGNSVLNVNNYLL